MTTNPNAEGENRRKFVIVREIDRRNAGPLLTMASACRELLERVCREVWRECDGEKSVADIADALGEDERAVWLDAASIDESAAADEYAIAFPPTTW